MSSFANSQFISNIRTFSLLIYLSNDTIHAIWQNTGSVWKAVEDESSRVFWPNCVRKSFITYYLYNLNQQFCNSMIENTVRVRFLANTTQFHRLVFVDKRVSCCTTNTSWEGTPFCHQIRLTTAATNSLELHKYWLQIHWNMLGN